MRAAGTVPVPMPTVDLDADDVAEHGLPLTDLVGRMPGPARSSPSAHPVADHPD